MCINIYIYIYLISKCLYGLHLHNIIHYMSQVNPVRSKELTNIRAASKDENVKLTPPRLVCTLIHLFILIYCFVIALRFVRRYVPFWVMQIKI